MYMQAELFQTLADPSRLAIVAELRRGEHAVNDLVARMAIHQSGVSRHLRILEEAGFVRVRPDGPKRFYSLRPEPFKALDGWLAEYREVWAARLDAFGDALARKQLKRRRSGAIRRKR
jgi:DNA-binding transcriptional ArsR family regulator